MKTRNISLALVVLAMSATMSTAVSTANASEQPLTPAESLKQALAELGPQGFTDTNYKPGLIRHLVLFRYENSVTPEQKQEIKERFLALQKSCKRNGHEYILSIETGTQNSGEGVDQNLEQGFMVTFKSEGDRNYYVGQPVLADSNFYDPAHQAFKEFVGQFLHTPINPTGVVVFDFKVEAKTRSSIN